MSYDLMVFEKSQSPTIRKEFMVWYEKQTEWNEKHDYQTISVASPSLRNWFMEMIEKFPPMNGGMHQILINLTNLRRKI